MSSFLVNDVHNQAGNVPAFLSKLKLLVDNPQTDELIYWDPSGKSFHIRDGNKLAKEVLPLFFKHNNISSFIRQLNMYGFRKMNRSDSVMGTPDTEDMEFSHQYFIRNNETLLSKIHRRPPSYNFTSNILSGGFTGTTVPTSTLQQRGLANGANRIVTGTEFNRLSEMVRQMRARQESTTQQMHVLRSENHLLHREMAHLRNQLEQQGQLIQTLFNFLSALATEGRNSGIRIGSGKRKLALTGAQIGDGTRDNILYDWDAGTLAEKARCLSTSPGLQRMLFSQQNPALLSSNVPSATADMFTPRVQVIKSPTPTVSSPSAPAPILALQDAPKRPRLKSGVRGLLPKASLSHQQSPPLAADLQDIKLDFSFDENYPLSPSDGHLSLGNPNAIDEEDEDLGEFADGNLSLSDRAVYDSLFDPNLPSTSANVGRNSLIGARGKKLQSNSVTGTKLLPTNRRPNVLTRIRTVPSPTLATIQAEPIDLDENDVSDLLQCDDPHGLDDIGADGDNFDWPYVAAQETVGDSSGGLYLGDIPSVPSPSYMLTHNSDPPNISDDKRRLPSPSSMTASPNLLTPSTAPVEQSPRQITEQTNILDSLYAYPALKSLSPSIASPRDLLSRSPS